jgi:hypothetical protein
MTTVHWRDAEPNTERAMRLAFNADSSVHPIIGYDLRCRIVLRCHSLTAAFEDPRVYHIRARVNNGANPPRLHHRYVSKHTEEA